MGGGRQVRESFGTPHIIPLGGMIAHKQQTAGSLLSVRGTFYVTKFNSRFSPTSQVVNKRCRFSVKTWFYSYCRSERREKRGVVHVWLLESHPPSSSHHALARRRNTSEGKRRAPTFFLFRIITD